MKKSIVSVVALALLVVFGYTVASAKPMCYSARACSGKVLNNRDKHNCKNSGGKSWRGNPAAHCENL